MGASSINVNNRKASGRGIKKVKCVDCKHRYFMGPCGVFHGYPNPQAYRICPQYCPR